MERSKAAADTRKIKIILCLRVKGMQCRIVENFFDMLQCILDEQKTPKDYGAGIILYHSEVDLLEKIGRFQECNVSRLSKICGVTKSAITQMTGKLGEKGLIEKYSPPKNKKEKYFRLTEKGLEIRKGHEDYHRQSNAEIQGYLCALGPEQKKVVGEFMEKVKKCTPFCVFNCNCESGCAGKEGQC